MGQPWVLALCLKEEFSEYLLYGCHVASDPSEESRHRWLDYSGPCHTYWWGTKMTESDLREFIAGMAPAQVAICLQSHGQTPVDVIRMATGFAR